VARNPQLEQSVQFVFPAAPLLLDDTGMMPGRAWWNLDVNALLMAVASGQVDIIRRSVPEGLAEARRKLNSALHHIQEHWKLKPSQLVLGGFSQGAMLATDVALRMTGGPAALAIFSGTLICEEEWRQLARKKTGLRVLQSHGRYDTILPFVAATWLRDLFAENGLDVDFIEFPGDHTIPRVALDRFAELLTSLVKASG
jgi:phospholipase/carboxylesterase